MASQAATRMLQPTAPTIPPTQPRGPAVPLPAAPPPPRGEQVYQPLGMGSGAPGATPAPTGVDYGPPDPGVMGMPQQAPGAADLQLEKPPVTTEEKLAGVTSPEFYQKWAQPGQYYDPKTGTYKELIPGGGEVASQDIQAEALAMLEKRGHEGYGMSEEELQQAKDVITSQMYDQFTQIAEEMAWSGRAGAGGLLARGFGRAGAGAAQELKKLFVENAKIAVQEKIAYIDRMLQMYGAKLNAETVMALQDKRAELEKEMFAMEEGVGSKTEGFAMRQDVAYQAGGEGWGGKSAQAIEHIMDNSEMTYDEAAQYFRKGKDGKMEYDFTGPPPPMAPPTWEHGDDVWEMMPEWKKAMWWHRYSKFGDAWDPHAGGAAKKDDEGGVFWSFWDAWKDKLSGEDRKELDDMYKYHMEPGGTGQHYKYAGGKDYVKYPVTGKPPY